MRLATVRLDDGRTALAHVTDAGAAVLRDAAGEPRWADVGQLLRVPGALDALVAGGAAEGAADWSLEDVPWDVPVVQPDHILCVAANYRAHIEETGTITFAPKSESAPWFFNKPQSSLNAHQSPIRIPARYGEKVDWESELGVIIGRGGSLIEPEDAFDHVAGYTVINDISARAIDVPERSTLRDRDGFHDWLHGKWFDTFCCVGPWMITPDELGDVSDIRVSLTLNDEVWQDASTAQMIFDIPTLISFVSSIVTLRPGDLIATGTPAGVGKSKGRFLTAGDVVVASVEGVGSLRNPVVAAS